MLVLEGYANIPSPGYNLTSIFKRTFMEHELWVRVHIWWYKEKLTITIIESILELPNRIFIVDTTCPEFTPQVTWHAVGNNGKGNENCPAERSGGVVGRQTTVH